MKPLKRLNFEALTVGQSEHEGARIELGIDESTGMPRLRFLDDSGAPRLVIGLRGESDPEVLFLRKDGSQLLRAGQDEGGFSVTVRYANGQAALSAVVPPAKDIEINVQDVQGNSIWACK